MDYRSIYERICSTVETRAYLTPVQSVDGRQRTEMQRIQQQIQASNFEPDPVRSAIHEAYRDGRIDRVLMLSALHVVACHPSVADWSEAARLVGEQELAALDLGGPRLQANLASVERHRGVLAFLRGHYEVALDYFARALERQRSSENLQNILCTLIRLGDEEDARTLLVQIRGAFPSHLVEEINHLIELDPDLALLREESP